MHQALEAKFAQNAEARRALLATAGLVLVHELPRDSVAIPGRIFAGMLMEIRETILKKQAVCRNDW